MPFDIQARACIGGPATDEVKLIVNGPTLTTLVGDLVSANLGVAPPGIFNGATFGAYQNGLIPDENTTFGDLVECNFTGYSRSANLTFSPAGLDDQGNHVVVADMPDAWQCTGDTDQQIQGVFLSPNDDANVALAAGALDTPISLANGTLVPGTVTLQVGNSD